MTDPDAVEALRPGEQGVDAFALGVTERAREELGRDHQGRLRRVKVGRLAWFQREEVERIAANGLPPTSRDVSGKARQSA